MIRTGKIQLCWLCFDSVFPDGQGGSPITVNGTIAVEELGLAGSQIDINGNIFSDRIRLFAQSFAGAFIPILPRVLARLSEWVARCGKSRLYSFYSGCSG